MVDGESPVVRSPIAPCLRERPYALLIIIEPNFSNQTYVASTYGEGSSSLSPWPATSAAAMRGTLQHQEKNAASVVKAPLNFRGRSQLASNHKEHQPVQLLVAATRLHGA